MYGSCQQRLPPGCASLKAAGRVPQPAGAAPQAAATEAWWSWPAIWLYSTCAADGEKRDWVQRTKAAFMKCGIAHAICVM